MAEPIEDIAAQLRLDHPTLTTRVNKQDVPLDARAYDARILDMATAVRQAQLDAEADAVERDRRNMVRDLLTALDAGTATNRQAQGALALLIRHTMREERE